MKKGFDRLRGVAAASALGLGLLGGAGSVRAVTVTTKTKVGFGTTTYYSSTSSSTFVNVPTEWNGIGNQNNVMGNQSITTSGGFSLTAGQSAFGISDATHRHLAWVFENGGAMFLAVGNNLFVNPDNTVDLTDKNITTDTVVDIAPGVNAEIQYQFYSSKLNSTRKGGVVRALYSVTNTTGASISTPMLVMGNYGSNATTTVHGTSDGDLIVEASDYWVASNRYTDPGGMKYFSGVDSVISSHGVGAAVVPVVAMAVGSPAGGSGLTDNFGYRYDVTIPAGETVRVMVFHEMSEWMDEALAAAPDFESLGAANTAGLLTGLSATQLSEIVNYGVDTDLDGVLNINDIDDDNDGFNDTADNCSLVVNDQLDSDGDGFGNLCDADFNNDNIVNSLDIGPFRDTFFNTGTQTTDLNGDGIVNSLDLGLFKQLFFKPPGPSGL